MRKLKTPEEIIKEASTEEGFDNFEDAALALIKAAQRDALECDAENAKMEVIEVPGAGSLIEFLKERDQMKALVSKLIEQVCKLSDMLAKTERLI